jgi:hypothetical protein
MAALAPRLALGLPPSPGSEDLRWRRVREPQATSVAFRLSAKLMFKSAGRSQPLSLSLESAACSLPNRS